MKVAFISKVSKTTSLPRENYFNRNMRRLKGAVMITALVGIGIFAGVRGTMAQNGNPNPQYGNYDYSKIRDPNWVRAEVNDYYSKQL